MPAATWPAPSGSSGLPSASDATTASLKDAPAVRAADEELGVKAKLPRLAGPGTTSTWELSADAPK